MPDARRARAGTLVVMAKAPVPGLAKTRLVPLLGPEGAAELHAVLLERTLRTAAAARFGTVALWCAPGRSAPFFADLGAHAGLELHDQPEGDLGRRMLAAFEAHLPSGPVLMIGTDSPGLAADALVRARAALDRAVDAVFVPAEDGGYAAIGLGRVDGALFDGMAWGSAGVMAATRARLRALGWTAEELAPTRDVDRPEDVEWLLDSGLLTDGERARIARYLP